jgi:hypothetical protein
MADYGEAMNKLREALLLLSQTTIKQDSCRSLARSFSHLQN